MKNNLKFQVFYVAKILEKIKRNKNVFEFICKI